ncbi:MAG: AtaL-like protein, partial [Noviherbaspirillum sp.]
LVLRAEAPKIFVPYLDRCTIVEKAEHAIERELQYGELVVRDRVTFLPQQRVVYHVPQQKGIPQSKLTMTIEEPESGVFFVRFEYEDETSAEADSTEAFYNEFRFSAYKESDIETISTIRMMAEDGQLDD